MSKLQVYTYYYTVYHTGFDGEHARFHPDEHCLFAARLLGIDRLNKTTNTYDYDDDRCFACGGLLQENVRVHNQGKD